MKKILIFFTFFAMLLNAQAANSNGEESRTTSENEVYAMIRMVYDEYGNLSGSFLDLGAYEDLRSIKDTRKAQQLREAVSALGDDRIAIMNLMAQYGFECFNTDISCGNRGCHIYLWFKNAK